MINIIAAIDRKRGLANDEGIPWPLLKADRAYFKQKTSDASVLMGYTTYQEFEEPLPDRRNLVLVRSGTELREGFEAAENLDTLLATYHDSAEVLWIIGGAKLYQRTIDHAQQLFLTHLQADFGCTKFFPEYTKHFELIQQGSTQEQGDIKFRFEVWHSSRA